MSKATVNETMKALKAKNTAEVDEASEHNKTLKRREALQTLTEKKKNGSLKRKLPAKRAVLSSDEEGDEKADVPTIDLDETGTINNKTKKTKKINNNNKKKTKKIPQEILLANSKQTSVYTACTCTPASLTDSYEKGATFFLSVSA